MNKDLFLDKYLHRIKLKKTLSPTFENLKIIQKQHLFNIPFENMNIFLDKDLSLDINDLFEKIIEKNRGGICYELNGLFLELLRKLGYEVKYISAKVRPEGTYWDHMVIMVNIDHENYITDVGFRDNYLSPLKIDCDSIQKINENIYKIKKLNYNKYELLKIIDNIEQVLYTFTTDEKNLDDFVCRCKYFETTPNTYFTNNPFCALETDNGKLFLTSNKFVITTDNNRKTIEVKNKEEFDFYLNNYFHMKSMNY